MNQAILIGRAGKDPEKRSVGQNNTSIATFSLCTSEPIPNSKDYKSTWHNIKCWGKTADRAYDDIRKGDEVFVSGKIEQESWDDKASGKKQYRTVINAQIVRMTAPAGPGKGSQSQQQDNDPGPEEQW